MKIVESNRESLMSPEQTEKLGKICSLLDEIFPVNGPLAISVVVCNNSYEADVVTRLTCVHCLWKVFDRLAEQYFAECIERELVKVLDEETQTRH